MREPLEIIDISQPVSERTACFPGDVPFSREVTASYADSGVMNLTRFTMSPHVGTHADAPVHVHGELSDEEPGVGDISLSPFIGPCVVVDISPTTASIETDEVLARLADYAAFPKRILFKSSPAIRYDVFEAEYASFSTALVERLAEQGVVLMGIDTPSVDPVDSKTLDTHHALIRHGMAWLENLDLTRAAPGEYFLSALPLRFTQLEASPVRAVLMR